MNNLEWPLAWWDRVKLAMSFTPWVLVKEELDALFYLLLPIASHSKKPLGRANVLHCFFFAEMTSDIVNFNDN